MIRKYRQLQMDDRELRKNGEGYDDPTAYEAIKNAEHTYEAERFYKVIGCILRICELSGYSLEEHIVLRDKRTGRVWR